MSSRRWSRPWVHVVALGAMSAVGGCKAESLTPTGNPPPRKDGGHCGQSGWTQPATWENVASSHPKGATNPPFPILTIIGQKDSCYKSFEGGIGGPPRDTELKVIEGRPRHARMLEKGTPLPQQGRGMTKIPCPSWAKAFVTTAAASTPPSHSAAAPSVSASATGSAQPLPGR